MLSSLPSEVVSLICSFSDATTFRSFTLINSAYNQNQTLYQDYIMKNYSPELFGFHVWDHTVLENKGFLPNGNTSLRWKDLFYRINSKKYLTIVGKERKIPVYFNETLLNIVQRVNQTCDIDKRRDLLVFDRTGGYCLHMANDPKEPCYFYKCYKGSMQTSTIKRYELSSVFGSIINDEIYLFDKLSFINLK
jgi:hypothetical protein